LYIGTRTIAERLLCPQQTYACASQPPYSRLWELSVLRLNQLGYFEVLKAEEAATIQRNTQSNTVDITLKVKERGKNSIGLNGGVSGIAGSFVVVTSIEPSGRDTPADASTTSRNRSGIARSQLGSLRQPLFRGRQIALLEVGVTKKVGGVGKGRLDRSQLQIPDRIGVLGQLIVSPTERA
jgi:outer membrane protein insertion porin family